MTTTRTTTAFLASALVLALAGCSASDPMPDPSSADPTAEAVVSTTPTPEPTSAGASADEAPTTDEPAEEPELYQDTILTNQEDIGATAFASWLGTAASDGAPVALDIVFHRQGSTGGDLNLTGDDTVEVTLVPPSGEFVRRILVRRPEAQ